MGRLVEGKRAKGGKDLRALLLDFDGTLVNTMPALWTCYKNFLKAYSIRATENEFSTLIGPSIPEIVLNLKETHGIQEPFEKLIDHYRTLLSKSYGKACLFFPDAFQVLQKAKDQQMKLAIVTSAPLYLLKPCLEQQTPADFFDVLITHDDFFASKPSPDPYLGALYALKVEPKEALAIEDSRSGIASARSAGLRVLQFAENTNITLYPGAMDLVHSWKEVEKMLGLT